MTTDSRVEIGSYSIAKSHNVEGNVIFWDKDNITSWIMIGYEGLQYFRRGSSYSGESTFGMYEIKGVDII